MCGCVSAATARASRANRVHLLVEGDGTRQHLDRDTTVQTGVGGAEHFAHATRTDRALDAKRSKEAAGRKFEPVAKQTTCEGPDRPIENDRGIVLPQQRFDLARSASSPAHAWERKMSRAAGSCSAASW